MTDHKHNLSFDDWDEVNFPRPAENDFDRVVERALSRRGFLGSVLAFGSGAAVMGTGLLKGSTALAESHAMASRFPFTPIAAQTDETVHVPEGYSWKVLTRWGDPLMSSAEGYDLAEGGALEGSDAVFGENTDGMELFSFDGHEIIAVNSEYTNNDINLPAAQEGVPAGADDVLKLQNLQGVTVMEVAPGADGYSVVLDSPFNRRLHHNTPMTIAGPAAGHALLQTEADATGTASLGTFNNCGSGKTPWGTYLTCEENFNGYFGATGAFEGFDEKVMAGYERYGIGADGFGYDYHKHDARFDVTANPNEPHRAGWVVEIDPTDPESTPVKHTGLGRFKHENAEVVLAADGRVVVYMGDDERGEFMYKFVSNGTWAPGASTEGLLDEGTLFAAQFNDDGTGAWLPLTPESTGMADLAEVVIFARMAASAVGATTMDRPEWISANPHAIEAYCCLTNNSRRGASAGEVNGPNPRESNNYGQIVRWRPHDDDHASETFDWDLYVMAGNPDVYPDNNYGGSDNVTAGNMFNSPDGMAFDSNGLLWIQTDGDDSNEEDFAGMGNNQMLVGDPVTGEIARFLTGPKGSEVTGLCWSADRRTMFVGIQHPGGSWPDGEGLPRSAVIQVTRDDGALIG
ncbi:PhoX family phosphatase [Oceanicola sp. 502str15]|uniref:PhoX family protein n=1 Tax=Oceanicola sp. 502str15 TaxID=2696061 RepID=UPI002094F9E7|nr:PhoX family phosphatase [Oceanicola sp. 502str15]MCO6382868.1 DUF839 domain-containing protein [Oceanicola sp. 502str15]